MPIRKPKPTSPGPPVRHLSDFAEVTRTEPEKSLTEGLKKSGGRNAHGRKTSRHRGGGAKRLYRKIDFKRRKDGDPGEGRAHRVRPQPLGLHRAASLRRRREAIHPRAAAAACRGDGPVRRRRRHPGREQPAAREHAGGHGRPQRRADAGSRRPDGRARRCRHPAARKGRRLRDAATALGRDADGSRRVPRHRRRRSATPIIRTSRSARPAASATWAYGRRRAGLR